MRVPAPLLVPGKEFWDEGVHERVYRLQGYDLFVVVLRDSEGVILQIEAGSGASGALLYDLEVDDSLKVDPTTCGEGGV